MDKALTIQAFQPIGQVENARESKWVNVGWAFKMWMEISGNKFLILRCCAKNCFENKNSICFHPLLRWNFKTAFAFFALLLRSKVIGKQVDVFFTLSKIEKFNHAYMMPAGLEQDVFWVCRIKFWNVEVKTRHVEGVCSTCKTMTTCFSSGVWSVFFAVLHANSSSMIVPEKSNIFFMIRVRFHVVKRHVFLCRVAFVGW